MKDRQRPECPRTEDLSALVDEELVGAARAEIATHAESCPLCGAMLQDLGGLRAALQPLAGARPGIDLAPLIEQRLRTVGGGSPRPPARSRSGWHGWRLLPQGFVAAGMFATGLYFGGLLAGGAAATSLQPAAMAMFDPIPPGGLCVGLPSCYPLGE
jgi:anti-sigma factor RsiW